MTNTSTWLLLLQLIVYSWCICDTFDFPLSVPWFFQTERDCPGHYRAPLPPVVDIHCGISSNGSESLKHRHQSSSIWIIRILEVPYFQQVLAPKWRWNKSDTCKINYYATQYPKIVYCLDTVKFCQVWSTVL